VIIISRLLAVIKEHNKKMTPQNVSGVFLLNLFSVNAGYRISSPLAKVFAYEYPGIKSDIRTAE
jgi:hypothetical protein